MLRLWQASLVRQFYKNRRYREPKATTTTRTGLSTSSHRVAMTVEKIFLSSAVHLS